MATFIGTSGSDTFRGTDGNDFIAGREGDDQLDGGGGNDFVEGGRGNDTLVFTLSENTLPSGRFTRNFYEGDEGTDTLVLRVTAAEEERFSGAIEALRSFIMSRADPDSRYGTSHTTAFGLTVRDFERLVVERVDGEENLPPSVDLDTTDGPSDTGFETTFTEDQGAVAIAENVGITDSDLPDGALIQSVTITLTRRPDGDLEGLRLDAAAPAGITVSEPDPGVIRYTSDNGPLDASIFEQLIEDTRYFNDSQNPTDENRIVTVVVNDGIDDSEPATSTIMVVGVNDPPTLDLDTDPESPGNDFETTFTEDAGPVAIASMNVGIDDVDGPGITSATITLTNPQDGALEGLRLNAEGMALADEHNIAFPDRDQDGVLTYTSNEGPIDASIFEQLIELTEYFNDSQNPDETDRMVTVVVDDGMDPSEPATSTIVVMAVNDDAPVVDLNTGDGTPPTSFSTDFSEGLPGETNEPVAIASTNVGITDPDGPGIASATLTLMNAQNRALEGLRLNAEGIALANENNISFPDRDQDGVITYTSNDGPIDASIFEQLIELTEYFNDSDDPTVDRTVEVVVSDGTNDSDPAISTISVTAVNDPPVVDLEPPADPFNEGPDGAPIASNVTITDPDGPGIVSAKITLGLEDGIAEGLGLTDAGAEIAGALGVTFAYDVQTGMFTLISTTGPLVAGDFELLIEAVEYRNSSADPTPGNRSITVTVNDGDLDSQDATTSISVIAVDDAPRIDLDTSDGDEETGFSRTFTEDQGPVAIASENVGITDPDGPGIESATLTLKGPDDSLPPDGADEGLRLTEAAAEAAADIGVDFDYDRNTGVATLVSTTGPIAARDFEILIEATEYFNDSQDPSDADRKVCVVVNDGTNDSDAAISTISVMPVNDAPTITLAPPEESVFTEQQSDFLITSSVSITDPDGPGIASARLVLLLVDGSPEGLRLSDAGATRADETGVEFEYVQDNGTGIATLTSTSGPIAASIFEELIGSIEYFNESDAPTEGDRTVTVTVDDGSDLNSLSDEAMSTFSVMAENDAPTLDLDTVLPGNDFPTTFTEGQGAVAIASEEVGITEPDGFLEGVVGRGIVSAQFVLTGNVDGVQEGLRFIALPPDDVFFYDPTTGIATLDVESPIDPAIFADGIELVQYVHTNEIDPTPGDRTIAVTVFDGIDHSEVATSTVTVLGDNDPPVVDLDITDDPEGDETGFRTIFTEDEGPVPIASVTVSITDPDPDAAGIVEATLTLRGPGNGDLPEGTNEGLQLSSAGKTLADDEGVRFVYGTGVATLTSISGDPLEASIFEQLIGAVEYFNSSQEPTEVERTVSVVVDDGEPSNNLSDPAISTIIVEEVNDPPALELGPGPNLNENAIQLTPRAIDNNLLMEDVDTPVFDGGHVLVSFGGTGSPDDQLGVLHEGTRSGQIGLDPSDPTRVLYEGVHIGTIDSAEDGVNGQPLRIDLNANAVQAGVLELLRSISYQTTSDAPAPTRTATFTVNDGEGGEASDFSDIRIFLSPDAPTLDLDTSDGPEDTGFMTAFTEGPPGQPNPPVAIASMNVGITDPDAPAAPLIASATITLRAAGNGDLPEGADEGLQLSASGATVASDNDVTFDYSVQNGAGVATLTSTTGPIAASVFEQLIEFTEYFNNAEKPTEVDRTVTVVVDDGTDPSNEAIATISVTAVNDPPILDLDTQDTRAPGNDFATTFTEDGPAVAVASMNVDITEPDGPVMFGMPGTGIVSARFAFVERPDGMQEELRFNYTSGEAVAFNYDPATGVATLTSVEPLDPSVFEHLISLVEYVHTNTGNPTPGDRTIEVTVFDGIDDSNVAVSTVTVVPVPDRPIVDLDRETDGVDFMPDPFTENDEPLPIAGDISITDPDLPDAPVIESAKLTLNVQDEAQEGLQLNEDAAAGADDLGVEFNYATGTGMATLVSTTGPIPARDFEALIRGVEYFNNSEDPTGGERTVTVVVNEGDPEDLESLPATSTFQVIPVNDAPVLDLDSTDEPPAKGFAAAFTEGQPGEPNTPVPIAMNVQIRDVDGPGIISATLTLSPLPNGTEEGLQLADGTATNGVDFSYDSGTGVATLTSSTGAPLDKMVFEQLIGSVEYFNDSEFPIEVDRTVSVVVDDGSELNGLSNQALSTISVTEVPDPPTLDIGPGRTFNENAIQQTAQAIDNNLAMEDVDTDVFAGGQVRISVIENSSPDDRLSVIQGGTGAGQIGVDDPENPTMVFYENVHIGTIGPSENGLDGKDLLIALNDNAVQAGVLELLRSISFRHTSDAPLPTRTVRFTVNDGTAADEATDTTVITILPANDPPAVDLDIEDNRPEDPMPPTGFATTFTEGDAGVLIAPPGRVEITDPDDPDAPIQSATLTLSLQDGTQEGLRLNIVGMQLAIINGVAFDYNDQSGVATLTREDGPINAEVFEELIESIEYFNDSDDPTADPPRTVTVVVNDGDPTGALDSLPATSTITVVPVNDPPALDLDNADADPETGFATSFTEGDDGVPIAPPERVAITDPDGPGIRSARFTLVPEDGTDEGLRLNGAGELLAAANGVTFDYTFSEETGIGTLALSAPSSVPAGVFQDLIESAEYFNDAAEPTAGLRTVDVTVNDGELDSNVATSMIEVIQNDPPLVDLNGAAGGEDVIRTFVEGLGPVRIAPDAVVTDADGPGIRTATLSMGVQDPQTEGLRLTSAGVAAASAASVSFAYNAGSGVATLTATGDPVAPGTFQGILREVEYFNPSVDPTGGNRTIEVVLSDGIDLSVPRTSTVEVIPVNSAPVIDLDTQSNQQVTATFVAGGDPVNLMMMDRVRIIDLDDDNLESARLELKNRVDGTDGQSETLGLNQAGLDLVEAIQQVNPSFAWSFDPVSGILTVSGAATKQQYADFLEAVVYDNAAANPTTGQDRFVDVTVDDGDDLSNLETSRVQVSPPVLTATAGGEPEPLGVAEAEPWTVAQLDFDQGYGRPEGYAEAGLQVRAPEGGRLIMGDTNSDGSGDLLVVVGGGDYEFSLGGAPFDLLSVNVVTNYGRSSFTASSGARYEVPSGRGVVELPESFRGVTSVVWSAQSGVVVIDDLVYAGAAPARLAGTRGSDLLFGTPADEVVEGGPGDDFLIGDAGDDTFVFAFDSGHDTIDDFEAGAGSPDVLDLRALGLGGFAEVAAAAAPLGDDTLLDLGDGVSVRLVGVDPGALHPDDVLI